MSLSALIWMESRLTGNLWPLPLVQAQRRSKEHSRSTSAMSAGDEKSEPSDNVDHQMSLYSNHAASSIGKLRLITHQPIHQQLLCITHYS